MQVSSPKLDGAKAYRGLSLHRPAVLFFPPKFRGEIDFKVNSTSILTKINMAISDTLNRRVRARPEEDDESVHSGESDMGDEVPGGGEGESDAEDQHSHSVRSCQLIAW